MSFKVSTGLRNSMLAVEDFKSSMDLGFLRIYKGAVPASADDSLGSASLLVEISVDGLGTGLTFDTPAVSGILAKAAAETWQGTCSDSGTATFFRFVQPADTGGAVPAELRAQGAVGVVGAELNLSNVSLTVSSVQTINHFNVALPTL